MSGIDWQSAKMDLREWISFAPCTVSELDTKLSAMDGVGGCVLLSTCNRTEVYITTEDGVTLDPGETLCRAAELPYEPLRESFRTKSGHKAVNHLLEVACGLRSQILGEDQIVTQVKMALELAHKAGAADGILQTLFRTAVTAGKEAKTRVRLTAAPLSVARRGVELAEAAAGSLEGTRAVVMGNGEMGRLASAYLVEKGCKVTVTLRSYRHGETIVPRGCTTVPYDQRFGAIDGCDLLLSATTSPHFTMTLEQMEGLKAKPRYVVDLALPRDIDPDVKKLDGITFFDMDSMGSVKDQPHNVDKLQEIQEIIGHYAEEFYRWWNFKQSLPVMEEIKELAVRRALSSPEVFPEAQRAVEQTVRRTVEVLLGGLRDAATPEALDRLRRKMDARLPEKHLGGGPMALGGEPGKAMKFPLFTDLSGRKAVVIGAGSIASRRIKILKEFGAQVTVIAPQIGERLPGVCYVEREYRAGDCLGAYLVVTATPDRGVNRTVAEECGEEIPVSVADCAEECTFFFPAICKAGGLVAGLVSDGTDHRLVARTAKEIREVLRHKEDNHEN